MRFNVPFFPEQASTAATQVDYIYLFLVPITAFFSLLIAALILFFIIKYKKVPGRKAEQIHGSMLLEITWTGIPLVLSLIIFIWAAWLYVHMQRAPANSLEVYGVAKQWMWKFQHSGGQREINALHVPVGRPVKVTLISQDVIHSMFVPEFRVKMDVLPNRYTSLWFEATKPGTYHLFCSQYCGTKHSAMIGQVIAMTQEDFENWLASGKAEGSSAAQGEKLFQQLGCVTCHRSDSAARGPSLVGLYGHPVKLTDGRTVIADDNYIRESILVPNAKVVSGFQPIMPTFQGMISEEDLFQVMNYIKSMGDQQQGGPLNNRSNPEQIRENELRHIQEQMKQQETAPQKPAGKQK